MRSQMSRLRPDAQRRAAPRPLLRKYGRVTNPPLHPAWLMAAGFFPTPAAKRLRESKWQSATAQGFPWSVWSLPPYSGRTPLSQAYVIIRPVADW